MLIFVSSPGDPKGYPKLKTTSLGSILREVFLARDEEEEE